MQNFKREEQNFVVQNEINNLGFLTGEGQTKMSKVNITEIAYNVGGYDILRQKPGVLCIVFFESIWDKLSCCS